MNSWMTNSTYLAQIGHFLGAYSLILTVTLCCHDILTLVVTTALGEVFVGLKEFWYDMKYELPKQTFWDSLLDWTFYQLGAIIGWLVVSHFVGVAQIA